MRINWNYIKIIVLGILVCLLMAFAIQRNDRRNIDTIQISFQDESKPYVTRDVVNKLLIQKEDSVTSKPKEKLDLKEMEMNLDEHPLISSADVYVTVGGQVNVAIVQRQPLARIDGTPSYYIDQTGAKMPLSDNYSARVPIISGVSAAQLKDVHELITYINNDSFLENHITGVSRQSNGDYDISVRRLNYKLVLGRVERLESKFGNYRAFYEKAKKDKTLELYKKIDLKYNNQVVCTKV